MTHIVKSGDCILSLAAHYGFLWKTVWNANPDLQKLRNNPNVLMPGDIVIIPDRAIKEVPCATEQRHRFLKKGTRARFRLIVEDFDAPLANRRYVLSVGSDIFQGTTDDDGLLQASIDPTITTGHLSMPDDGLEFSLHLGYLDPLEEITGVQHRLQNLGFYDGKLDGVVNDELHDAIADFQASVGLGATGELDDNTRQILFARQDQFHVPLKKSPVADGLSGENQVV